ncbi:hypothetical protein [Dictyobacter formicarum]|uniref:ABC3 transporter permease protein domain-containing protein n=1 Tax=Dictyobacter formicarum TaxID=2778368 RepID=A0ABQ3VSR9_9CHLR|nr:hypothetical protein [Dictyobacter formicarum]GHO88776.1 hypothetical protein KSZ_67820 [Dictyobacter formicarum]
MDVFADASFLTQQLLYFTGGAILMISILSAIIFCGLRIHKLRLLAEKRPAEACSYNAWLILLDYIVYALLAFLGSFLLASIPLMTALYIGSLIGQKPLPLLPLLIGGATIGLAVGCYVMVKFLYSKMTFEDSLLSSIARETR